MLTELIIKDFAIIDDLHVPFGSGLNILTGETGAGKSIIIDAIGLLLGDRASNEWVRYGSETATIEAGFQLDNSRPMDRSISSTLEENGLDDPDSPEWLLLSREVRSNGRNICRINGRASSLQMLSDITSKLIDIHGQGEHLNLLRPSTHLGLLDRYAGIQEDAAELARVVGELRAVRTELDELRQDARSVMQRVDMLTFQVEEIRSANLRTGEDIGLEGERIRLGNVESLLELAQAAYTILDAGDPETPSAIDMLGEAVARVARLATIDSGMKEQADEVQTVLEQLSALAATLQDYADNLEFNPGRLQEVEERIEQIHGLKHKYGDSIEEINQFGADAENELDRLNNWEARTDELEAQEQRQLSTVGKLAVALSELRTKAAKQMSKAIEHELQDLRMEKTRFEVRFERRLDEHGAILPDGSRVAFDSTGIDEVEFLMSANPGEPLKPLAKVASGGETARIMLALKSVLAQADSTATLVFDEIDQGIGGRVGAVVGKKLWALTGQANGAQAIQHQVLCVTHLPQLAAYGDTHFIVTKRIESANGEERTATDIRSLDRDSRVDELLSMLGTDGDSGRQSVEKILSSAEADKAGAGASAGE